MSETNNCGGCGVAIGSAHDSDCAARACLWTGGFTHDCGSEWVDVVVELRKANRPDLADMVEQVYEVDIAHDCGLDTWQGERHDVLACRRLGLWSLWGPGWRTVPAGTLGATEGLNELWEQCVWDRGICAFRLAGPAEKASKMWTALQEIEKRSAVSSD